MIALLLSLACVPASLSGQETWELLGVDQDGALIDMRWTVDDLGVLKGSGRTELAYVSPRNVPLEYGRAGTPDEVARLGGEGMVVGPDALKLGADGKSWTARARAEDFSLRLTLRASGPAAAPLLIPHDDRAWMVEAPVTRGELQGFITAGSRQEMVNGDAVLLRRSGDAPPALRGVERHGVYVLAPDLSVGVDQTGAHALSWIVVGDRVLEHEPGLLTRHEDGGFLMDFRPSADVQVRVRPLRAPRLATAPLAYLSAPERWLLQRLVGVPQRRLRAARADVEIMGLRRTATALIVAVSYE